MAMEKEIRRFYTKWSPRVLAFCCLMPGNKADGEQSCIAGFRAYVGRTLDLDLRRLPTLLFTFARDGKKPTYGSSRKRQRRQQAPGALLLLPWQTWAVFVLRTVMQMDGLTVGEIVEIPVHEVRRFQMSALLQLRKLLGMDVSQGRFS